MEVAGLSGTSPFSRLTLAAVIVAGLMDFENVSTTCVFKPALVVPLADMLTLAPPYGEPGGVSTRRPRDVAFVLDRSGSMGGWKMVAARRALGRMVDTLLDHDRFTVLAFDAVSTENFLRTEVILRSRQVEDERLRI